MFESVILQSVASVALGFVSMIVALETAWKMGRKSLDKSIERVGPVVANQNVVRSNRIAKQKDEGRK
jgi:hypothetical protein